MREALKYLKGDPVIWVLVSFLLGLSLLSVYSFVDILARTEGGSPLAYLAKHFVHICIGAVVMYVIHKQDPKYFSKLARFIFIIAIFLLAFTMLFGVKVNEASRWIKVPIIGISFQTSDLARLALILYLSKQLVKRKDDLLDWKKGFFPIVLPILIVCALIAKDNFSTSALIFVISLGVLFIGQFPLKRIAALIGSGIALFGILILLHLALPAAKLLPRFDTWMSRFFKAYGETPNLIDNAQAINAELAIHSGGFFGVGVGDGKLKEYTPEAYADFYFSSFVEEFGIISAILLILLYLILLYRIIRIGLNAEKLFETYICVGIGMLILSQASINMLVCTGIIPVTGQNIPFLTMGGSAMIMACVSVGIVQSIAAKQNEKNKNNQNGLA
ncbi:MAG: FtsW/RodA/SpoVE family cell cycle protein [Lishizhenia sp.]